MAMRRGRHRCQSMAIITHPHTKQACWLAWWHEDTNLMVDKENKRKNKQQSTSKPNPNAKERRRNAERDERRNGRKELNWSLDDLVSWGQKENRSSSSSSKAVVVLVEVVVLIAGGVVNKAGCEGESSQLLNAKPFSRFISQVIYGTLAARWYAYIQESPLLISTHSIPWFLFLRELRNRCF